MIADDLTTRPRPGGQPEAEVAYVATGRAESPRAGCPASRPPGPGPRRPRATGRAAAHFAEMWPGRSHERHGQVTVAEVDGADRPALRASLTVVPRRPQPGSVDTTRRQRTRARSRTPWRGPAPSSGRSRSASRCRAKSASRTRRWFAVRSDAVDPGAERETSPAWPASDNDMAELCGTPDLRQVLSTKTASTDRGHDLCSTLDHKRVTQHTRPISSASSLAAGPVTLQEEPCRHPSVASPWPESRSPSESPAWPAAAAPARTAGPPAARRSTPPAASPARRPVRQSHRRRGTDGEGQGQGRCDPSRHHLLDPVHAV